MRETTETYNNEEKDGSTLNVTKTIIMIHETAAPPPTSPPPVQPEPRSVALSMVIPAEDAEAVAVSSTAMAGAASAISPTAATHAVRASSVLRSVNCHFDTKDVTPTYLEHPIRIKIGSSILGEYAGSCLVTTLLFIVFPCGINITILLWGPQQSLSSKKKKNKKREESTNVDTKGSLPTVISIQKNGFAIFSSITLVYFFPNVWFGVVLVLLHPSESDGVATGAAIACVITLVVVFVAYAIQIVKFYSKNVITTARQQSKPGAIIKDARILYGNHPKSTKYFVEAMGPMFDATSDGGILRKRIYYMEEVAVSSLMMMIAGIRPYEGSCSFIAGSLILLAAIHMCYLIWTRPYFSRIESFFAYVQSGLQLVLAASAVASVSNPSALQAIGVGLLVQGALFFLQAIVMAIWAWTREQRRELLRVTNDESLDDNDNSNNDYEMPLLSVNPLMMDGNDDEDGSSSDATGTTATTTTTSSGSSTGTTTSTMTTSSASSSDL